MKLQRVGNGKVGTGPAATDVLLEGWFCPHCGEHAELDDWYCRACGHVLESQADQADNAAESAQEPASQTSEAEGRSGDGLKPPEGQAPRRTRLAAWAHRHKRVLIGGALAVALGLAAGGLFLILWPADTAPAETQTALSATATATDDSTDSAADANLLKDIRAAGLEAHASIADVARQQRKVADISTTRYRSAAAGLLAAERAYLRDLGALRGLRRSTLHRWYAIKRGLSQSIGNIASAEPAVRELHLANPAKALPSLLLVDHAIASLDQVLTRDIRNVTAWRSSLASAKAEQATELASANSYAETLRGYLAQYDSLRSETSGWIEKVDSSGATYDEAYQVLGDATTERQNIKDSIDALEAPGPLAGPQSALSAVLAKAVQAMGDAVSGIATYQFSYRYPEYKQTPGWQHFEATSEEITSEFGTAVSNWEAAVSEYVAAIEGRPMPKPPAI